MAGLYEKIKEYTAGDRYPMHMPGHKRKVELLPDYAIDMTEIREMDNLHCPEGIIKECMNYAKTAYQSLDTFFVVNGATGALQGAIYAATNYGDKILVARNCHKSVYNMIAVRGLKPVYLSTDRGTVPDAEVAKALQENPDISVAVITSPSYDGRVCDVEKIANLCHENQAMLIVDEAHGAHLPFAHAAGEENYFTRSAMYQGADLVVQSLHKTLPAMTQTAVLHRMSERIDSNRLLKSLSIFETSSPSYVLMTSIDECIRYTYENRNSLFTDYKKRLTDFWQKAGREFPVLFDRERLTFIMSVGSEEDDGAEILNTYYDPGKILICGKNLSMTGGEIYDILISNYGIIPEMYAGDYCLCMTGICDTGEGFERLAHALEEIARGRRVFSDGSRDMLYPPSNSDYYCTPAEAEKYKKIAVKPDEIIDSGELICESLTKPLRAENGQLVCGEMVAVYPPGVPVLVPGEYIKKESIDYIIKALRAGNEVNGVIDGCIIVLAEE